MKQNPFAGGAPAYLGRISSSGSLEWELYLSSPPRFSFGDRATYAAATSDGGYIVTGSSGGKSFLIKVQPDSSGTTQKDK